MEKVRLGVIGVGGMGQYHLSYLPNIPEVELTAICTRTAETLARIASLHQVKSFTDYHQLIDSGLVDAVLIVTPHYAHTPIAIYAFEKGIHVLCEKPIAVHVKDAERMIQAHEKSQVVFAVMFQMRLHPLYQKLKELIDSGELGELVRVNWIMTDWFRSQTYYDSGTWRATWKGEGGGVLINQCPHNLDLLQWLTGLPKTIYARAYLGKTHDIEVEDEVMALLEYENGATGVFVTSTGEAPGTDRLEIAGDRGKMVVENGSLSFYRTRISVKEFLLTTQTLFDKPETWKVELPVKTLNDSLHQLVTQNFVNAILHREQLIAPGAEGIKSLALGNAMLLSGLKGQVVELPLDSDAYEAFLKELVEKYSREKREVKKIQVDMASSFHKP